MGRTINSEEIWLWETSRILSVLKYKYLSMYLETTLILDCTKRYVDLTICCGIFLSVLRIHSGSVELRTVRDIFVTCDTFLTKNDDVSLIVCVVHILNIPRF
jgi:hypothetical protein